MIEKLPGMSLSSSSNQFVEIRAKINEIIEAVNELAYNNMTPREKLESIGLIRLRKNR